MKKIPILITFIFLLIVTACGGPYLSKTSELYILKKAHSEDDQKAWIIAFDPNSITGKKKTTIMVKEAMVWNLIEVNKTYLITYSKKGDNPWVLEQIENRGDDDTIR
ncbi:hypothetical protein [Neobacillus vireti]|uniref:hypothetical protein n=1 Tax=Neobacillus vireti TaxID=220686 RepID=UPI002FFF9136